MKTLRILTLLTFVLALGLFSCSSDDEKKDETLATQILGTWDVPVDPVHLKTRESSGLLTLQFKDNLTGSLKTKVTPGPENGPFDLSYKIDVKDVTMIIDFPGTETKNNVAILKVSSINAKTMIGKIYQKDGQTALFADKDYTFTKVSK